MQSDMGMGHQALPGTLWVGVVTAILVCFYGDEVIVGAAMERRVCVCARVLTSLVSKCSVTSDAFSVQQFRARGIIGTNV